MSPTDRLINKGLYFRERPIALHKQSGLIALIAIARLQLHSSIHSLSHDFLYMTHQHDYILFHVALKKKLYNVQQRISPELRLRDTAF